MEATQAECIQRTSRRPASRLTKALYATAALLLWTGGGCGPAQQEESSPLEPGTTAQELTTLNGLAFNGLSNEAFTAWFGSDPAMAHMLMKYIVACAVPAGQSWTYTHGGTEYTWQGWLGLAPDWAGGSPATLAEQQIISACLAAQGNKYGSGRAPRAPVPSPPAPRPRARRARRSSMSGAARARARWIPPTPGT
ncbi:MAG TPA: hypothetical protein VEU33_50980 [Archangium sp.]|nr:hypothetical protein [Archangium sp.]